ncbi:hypothetical protein ACFOWX_01025 [Sphingorhabdus arenilitoris]|uniref:Uncharacterized protein n=1 Tax=Sphingorhabdus arenilitoris TaxID=1490041 RepID=A0ABV8RCA0_9SPHN
MRVWRLGLAALAFITPVFAAAQESKGMGEDRGSLIPAGEWQRNFELSREDPRIRTKGGADLLRIQVIQDKGAESVQVSWTAGRAICEDPNGEPCESVGASGTVQGRILGKDLVFAIPLSAQAEDPTIVILRGGVSGGKNKAPLSGYMMNALGDYAYKFTYSAASN